MAGTVYKVSLQVVESEDETTPLGPEVTGRVWVNDPTDRKAFVTEFGWLGHALREELQRQWQITCTVSEASASSPEPS